MADCKTARAVGLVVMTLGAVAAGSPAVAYNVLYSYPLGGGETGYSKWGDPHAGTPSGVLTWSLMPNGTGVDPSAPPEFQGTSNLASVFNQVGGEAAALAMIQAALGGWSDVANVQFQHVGVDDGTPFGGPTAAGQMMGHLRFGAFEFQGGLAGAAAAGYGPGGVSTLGGDIVFNTRPEISFYAAPGVDGELYDLFPPGGGLARNDFGGLVAHELGHVLGLDHSDVPSGCMCGYVSPAFDGSQCAYYDSDGDGRAPINRMPDADDVAGAQFLYGPALNADFDGDEDVDGGDFLAWQRGVGLSGTALRTVGDANGDHNVNGDDLAIWRGQFASATSAAVPEPSTGVSLLMGVLVWRRRRCT